MPIVNKYSKVQLIKQFNYMLSGELKANVKRKTVETTGGIEKGFTWATVYTSIDCDIQPITRKDWEQMETALPGILSALDKMGYFPRYISYSDTGEIEELTILEDDLLEIQNSSKTYKVKRVDEYEDHLELLIEKINK